MKNCKHFLLLLPAWLFVTPAILFSQQAVPGRINYQTVLRNLSSGQPLVNQNISMRFTILENDEQTIVYQETHFAEQTNAFGLINLRIGEPDMVNQGGSLSLINWWTSPKKMRIEFDPGNGNAFQLIGVQPLNTVPYAFAAKDALGLQGKPVNNKQPVAGQVLKFNGTEWQPDTDNTGGGGTNNISVVAPLAGDGSSANPVNISTNSIGSNLIQDGSISANDLAPGVLPVIPFALPPNGPASGDLSGAYPNPTVARLQNTPVSSQVPFNGQVLKYNNGEWRPGTDESSGGGSSTVTASFPITGNGSSGSPLNIAQNSLSSQYIQDGSINANDLAPGTIPSTLPPSGAASGDLSGQYPAPTVVALRGQSLSNTFPTNGQVLQWNGSQWVPASVTGGGGTVTGITAQTPLTGGTITNSGSIGLSTSGVTPGQYGNGNQIPVISVDQYGRITSAGTTNNNALQTVATDPTLTGAGTTSNALRLSQQGALNGQVLKWSNAQNRWIPDTDNTGGGGGTVTGITAQTPLTGGTITNSGSIGLSNSGVTPGQYGNSTQIPVISVDQYGRVTSAGTTSNTALQTVATDPTLAGSGTPFDGLRLAQQGAANGQVLKWSSAQNRWIPDNDNTGGGGSGGTVTGITAQAPLTGGTITNSGSIGLSNSGVTPGQYGNGSQVPVLNVDQYGRVTNVSLSNITTTGLQTVATGTTLTGNGTAGNPINVAQQGATEGQILKWSNAANRWVPANEGTGGGNSQWRPNGTTEIYYDGNVGVGVSDPSYKLHISTGNNGGVGLYGESIATSPSVFGTGVAGIGFGGELNPTSQSDIGVYGSANDVGVLGLANNGPGVSGFSRGGNFAGVQGFFGGATSGAGVRGTSISSTGWGGIFDGGLLTTGEVQFFRSANNQSFITHSFGPTTQGGGAMILFSPSPIVGTSNLRPNVVINHVPNAPSQGQIGIVNTAGNALAAGMRLNAAGQGELFGLTKAFKMPHPANDKKDIWYCAIEGPEAAAYVRGTGKLHNGEAHIEFPEHFRYVVNPTTLTVVLTPLSADSKGMAVIEKTERGFKVKELLSGNGNYAFDWEVKGVRQGLENWEVIRDKEPLVVPVSEKPVPDKLLQLEVKAKPSSKN